MAVEVPKTMGEHLLDRYALEVHTAFLSWAALDNESRERERLNLFRNVVRVTTVESVLRDLGLSEQCRATLEQKVIEFQESFPNVPVQEFNVHTMESWVYQIKPASPRLEFYP